jgi:SAM-dependent methyltransferase
MKLYHQLAEYYFAIENHHRDIADDISLIRSLLHGVKNPSLLDLGCGTGEHLFQLSRLGIRCSGLDSSEDMIKTGLSRYPEKIAFIRTDITDFDYYDDFDIVTSFFGSMNYLVNDGDIDRAFWNIWRALKDDSPALLEIWNSYPIKQIMGKEMSRVSTTYYNGLKIDRQRGFRILPEITDKTVVEVNYRYIITGQGSMDELVDRHVMRSWSLEEIRPFIENNGFVIKNLYANSLREPFQNLSNKMLFHLRKA